MARWRVSGGWVLAVLLAGTGVVGCRRSEAQSAPEAGPSRPVEKEAAEEREQARLPPHPVVQAKEKRERRENPTPTYQRSQQMFVDRCSSCHGEKGDGYGPWHTMFQPSPANLGLIRDTPSMIESIIINGIANTAMPAFPDLAPDSIREMLVYLTAQPKDLSNQWDKPWELKGEGEQVAAELGRQDFLGSCAGCHGTSGGGDGPYAEVETVWPKPANFRARNSDPGRLFYIIEHGRPGTFMPPAKGKLPELAMRRLAVHVESLFQENASESIPVPKKPVPRYQNKYSQGDRDTVAYGNQRLNLWCAPCHGENAHGGFQAPRLIDRQWKYGLGTDTAVFTIVTEGVPGRLMPAFRKLPEDERWQILTWVRYKGGLPDPAATEAGRK